MKLIFLFLVISTLISQANTQSTTNKRNMVEGKVIEMRTYHLKPDSRAKFHQLFTGKALPMLVRWKVEVIGYGPSQHDEDSYFLCRAYNSPEDRQQSQDAFYGSDEWVKGPREAILALIENYTTLVLPADSFYKYFHTMRAIPDQKDMQQLKELNMQFIKNFVSGDTVEHNKIIHEDFVCIESSGRIVDRADYMKGWATGYKNSGYSSFSISDESIRIFGDVALVRSKTNYEKVVDGKTMGGNSVYTDTYKKENGKWMCVQAQITAVK